MNGPLTLGWLLVAHLVADFVLQPDWMAAGKYGAWPRALPAFALHGLVVAACLVPFALAFGAPGLWTLAAVAPLHVLVDAAKARLTRRAEGAALRLARAVHEPPSTRPATLGTGWTPLPAALFLADQAAHVAVLVAVWWAWLHGAALTAGWTDGVARLTAGVDPSEVRRLAAAVVVGAGLLIVNVRAGSFFVALLLRPAPALSGAPQLAAPAPEPPVAAAAQPGYRLRIGPFRGELEPVTRPGPVDRAVVARLASPGRVGAAIGILERLLVVLLMLFGAQLAIGLVVAAKTLARFKQLDDREFAEYYLLGTLASVTIAVASAIVASAALGVL